MKEVFKVGDKVYHIQYGWGVISKLSINDILVDFQNKISAWVSSDGNLLSFTEYTLKGFSQERPIELPEVGELCLVKDLKHQHWIAKKFISYNPEKAYPYSTENDMDYQLMKRIKILD